MIKKLFIRIFKIMFIINIILIFIFSLENKSNNIVLISNKTSGHINNLLSIADKLKKLNFNPIFFINTSKHEEDIFNKTDYEFYKIKSKKDAFKFLKKTSPVYVLSSGGGFSIFIIKIAKLMNIKCGVIEPNFYPGRGSTIMKSYSTIFCSNKNLQNYFGKHFVFSNNPIRNNIQNNFKNNSNKTILILSGTNGIYDLNKYIYENINKLLDSGFKIIWQRGILSKYELPKLDNLITFKYDNNIEKYLNEADLVISAAGANTVNELVYLEKPFLLFPCKQTFANHQIKNSIFLNKYISNLYFFDCNNIFNKAFSLLRNESELINHKNNIIKFKKILFNDTEIENNIINDIVNYNINNKMKINKVGQICNFFIKDKFNNLKYKIFNKIEDKIMEIKLLNKNDYILYDNIPIVCIISFVVKEDSNYFIHNGYPYDIKTYYKLFKNKKGGSGIFQQLIKNIFFKKGKVKYLKWLKRKNIELILTYAFKKFYTKKIILEMYLNLLYYIDYKNNDIEFFGIKKMVNYLFNKNLNEISIKEIIILTSINHNPIHFMKFIKNNIYNNNIQKTYCNLLSEIIKYFDIFKLSDKYVNEYKELVKLKKENNYYDGKLLTSL